MKIYKKILFTLVFTLLVISVYSQNVWEYYFRDIEGNNGSGFDELILNVEEIENGDLISTTWRYYDYYNQNEAPAIIRLHNGKTGEVYKEVEYNIDSLTPQLDWIFYDKESEIFTIIGAAHYINVEEKYRRGYFLLTRWDKDLNLLKDTLVRLEPVDQNFYLWYFNCNYTKERDYLVFGKYGDKFDSPPINGNTDLLIKIDKSGEIIKKKFYKNDISSGQHGNLIEDIENDRYILLGPNTYFLDSNFMKIGSFYVEDLPDGVEFQFNHTTAMIFPPNKLLLTAQINYFHRGVALMSLDLQYIKSYDLTTNTKPNTIEFLLGRRSMDYIDTSSIYLVSQERYSHYYTLSRVNSELEPYWIKYFSENDTLGHFLWSMKATLDGGCIIAGDKGISKVGSYKLPHHPGSWMKKYDKSGNSVSIEDFEKDKWEITVYPNPSKGDFIIEIEGNTSKTNLKFFDIQGRVLKVFNALLSGTNNLQMNELLSGMYIWKLEKNGRIIGNGKWVKN